MQREAATAAPRKQSSLRTAAIITICVLGLVAGLSLLALRQTAIHYHQLLEARKDFGKTHLACQNWEVGVTLLTQRSVSPQKLHRTPSGLTF